MVELETARLWLRPLVPEDAVVYAALWSDPRVHPAVVANGPVPPGAVPALVARRIQAWADGTCLTWSILTDDHVVGYVAVERPPPTEPQRHGRVCVAVAPRCWRQGVASEALRAVCDAADLLELDTLEVQLPEGAPEGPFTRAGFVAEGGTLRWRR